MNKLMVVVGLMLSLNVIGGETVTIVSPSGDIQICKVTESGAIVCL